MDWLFTKLCENQVERCLHIVQCTALSQSVCPTGHRRQTHILTPSTTDRRPKLIAFLVSDYLNAVHSLHFFRCWFSSQSNDSVMCRRRIGEWRKKLNKLTASSNWRRWTGSDRIRSIDWKKVRFFRFIVRVTLPLTLAFDISLEFGRKFEIQVWVTHITYREFIENSTCNEWQAQESVWNTSIHSQHVWLFLRLVKCFFSTVSLPALLKSKWQMCLPFFQWIRSYHQPHPPNSFVLYEADGVYSIDTHIWMNMKHEQIEEYYQASTELEAESSYSIQSNGHIFLHRQEASLDAILMGFLFRFCTCLRHERRFFSIHFACWEPCLSCISRRLRVYVWLLDSWLFLSSNLVYKRFFWANKSLTL